MVHCAWDELKITIIGSFHVPINLSEIQCKDYTCHRSHRSFLYSLSLDLFLCLQITGVLLQAVMVQDINLDYLPPTEGQYQMHNFTVIYYNACTSRHGCFFLNILQMCLSTHFLLCFYKQVWWPCILRV